MGGEGFCLGAAHLLEALLDASQEVHAMPPQPKAAVDPEPTTAPAQGAAQHWPPLDPGGASGRAKRAAKRGEEGCEEGCREEGSGCHKEGCRKEGIVVYSVYLFSLRLVSQKFCLCAVAI